MELSKPILFLQSDFEGGKRTTLPANSYRLEIYMPTTQEQFNAFKQKANLLVEAFSEEHGVRIRWILHVGDGGVVGFDAIAEGYAGGVDSHLMEELNIALHDMADNMAPLPWIGIRS